MHLPFEESAALRDLRQRAARLALSDLPITIDGEPGTGRRTLAAMLVEARAEEASRASVTLEGTGGGTDEVRAAARKGRVDVLAHNLDALPALQQREIAALVHGKQIRLVGVSGLRAEHVPELEVELATARLTLPPLRERAGDAVAWAEFFIRRGRLPVSLSDDARRAVRSYRWPGNLIELEGAIKRAACLASSVELRATDLGIAASEPAFKPLADAVEEFKMAYIDRALAHFGGNRTQAAKALGLEPRTIFRYLQDRK